MSDVVHTISEDEARAKHLEIRNKIGMLIEEAVAISEASGVPFQYEPDHIGEYFPTGCPENPYSGEDGDGEWYPSSWSSSSLYC